MSERLIDTWTDLAQRLLSAGSGILDRSNITTRLGLADERVLSLALLARTLSNLKCVLLLLREGQIVEARTIVRCCYENLYWTLALVGEGRLFAVKMILDYLGHQKARGEFYFKFEEEFDAQAMAKLRKSLKLITHFSLPRMNPKEVALLGDAAKTYYKYAELSSEAAHPTMGSLKRHIETDGVNGTSSFRANPNVDDLEVIQTLDYVCRAVMGVCIHVLQLLKQQPDAAFSQLMKEFADHANSNVA